MYRLFLGRRQRFPSAWLVVRRGRAGHGAELLRVSVDLLDRRYVAGVVEALTAVCRLDGEVYLSAQLISFLRQSE